MAKVQIKRWRKEFREGVFARDKNRCRVCGQPAIDAHHILNRKTIPNDGYVLENGISLCSADHVKAEKFHVIEVANPDLTPEEVVLLAEEPGYSPDELFARIGSSRELAIEAASRLK